MFYFILFIILLTFSLIECCNVNAKIKTLLLYFGAAILFITAGTRYETGGDWDIYTLVFENIDGNWCNLTQDKAGFEPGFFYLNWIIKCCGGNIQTVYFVISLFNIIVLVKCLNDYIPQRAILGLLIYYSVFFFTLEMIYTRQSVAVILCLYSIRYIKSRKLAKFLFVMFLAFMFHRLTLLFIPIYFISAYRISSRSIIAIAIVGMVISGLGIKWFGPLYLNLSELLGGTFYEKALYYVATDKFAVSRVITFGFFVNAMFFLLFIQKRNVIEKSKYGNICINILIMYIFAYYYLYEMTEISYRVSLMFLTYLLIGIPIIIEYSKIRTNKIAIFAFVILYSLALRREIYLEKPNVMSFNPYQNYIYHRITGKASTGRERLEKANSIFKYERLNMKD